MRYVQNPIIFCSYYEIAALLFMIFSQHYNGNLLYCGWALFIEY